LLWRGHNEPGGGFVAGLIAAAGCICYALPNGLAALKRIMPINTLFIIALGLTCALVSGLFGLLSNTAYLTHVWTEVMGIALGTALLFDVGVYLTVLGSVLTFFTLFLEQ
jgi:multicomponent Na+:H+ antiporter subunit B